MTESLLSFSPSSLQGVPIGTKVCPIWYRVLGFHLLDLAMCQRESSSRLNWSATCCFRCHDQTNLIQVSLSCNHGSVLCRRSGGCL